MALRANPILSLTTVLLGTMLGISAASATVTVTNRDEKDHKLTVVEEDGAKKADLTLKALQVLEGICAKGCVIRLNDSEDDEYELEGTETVSIEEGYLYYDGPEVPGEAPAAAPAPAPTPGAPAAPAAPAVPEKKQ